MIPTTLIPLASHLWQSTLFAAAVGLLIVALRHNQARVRYWLWLAASYKFLLPFSWLVGIGHQFEWRTAPAIIPHTFSAVTDAVTQPLLLTALPAATPAPKHMPALLFMLCAVWACGFAAVAIGWIREWLRIRAIMREASPLRLDLPVCGEGEILRFAQNDSAKSQAIRVVSTPARLEPGVVGIFRPVLILPEGIATRLTQGQLQGILAHELAHVRRRDNLTAALHMLVEALFWFYPLVWWLGARLIDERERACDEEVLQSGGQAQVYAESILKVCEFYLESRLTCVSGITGSDLKKRIQRIMKNHFGVALSRQKKFLLATAAIAALGVPLVVGVLTAPRLFGGQAPAMPDWQIAAGGSAQFEVASIKPTKQDPAIRNPQTVHANIVFPGDTFTPTGGLFSATNYSLQTYIVFAYKLVGQSSVLQQFPNWAKTKYYDIEAHAPAGTNPTKDQYRLMMQALLADRFKFAMHAETRQGQIFAMVLDKPGKLGPQLQRHTDPSDCSTDAPSSLAAPATVGDQGYPQSCGIILDLTPIHSGQERLGARNLPLVRLANFLYDRRGCNDRPITDETGLTGQFDFVFEFTRPASVSPTSEGSSPNLGPEPDPDGPSCVEALKQQLGLKLVPTTGPVPVNVVDHIEEPTSN